ncbi:hypothetical protein FOMPIDRAFT_1023432 [Fomitopsis schrenkii]|uniref:Uncharacterized protein n=1 Tax=Fomitopsis schrenkii TaxID=2126942 RepID=S8E7T4_FOMSC|nr:hypothetical protein FOMPIDRAFT_1023432 [Fomitopsis schrenkii]
MARCSTSDSMCTFGSGVSPPGYSNSLITLQLNMIGQFGPHICSSAWRLLEHASWRVPPFAWP